MFRNARKMVRFRLSTLLVILAVAAIWMALISNRARNQQLAIAWLQSQGATVRMDWQFIREQGIDRFIGKSNHSPPGPTWIRRRLGDDYFQTVIGIEGSIEDLQRISCLTELRWLNLRNSQLANIEELAHFRRLERLTLCNTQVSDISPLRDSVRLESLHLTGSPVEDLSALTHASELQELGLNGTDVIQLDSLPQLPKLRILHVDRVQLTELEPFHNMASLTQLRIHDNTISDDELASIRASLPHLMVSR